MKVRTGTLLSVLTFVLAVLAGAEIVRAGDAAPASEKPLTLAVLNFSNRNPGDGWDWLEKGLADMLITDLAACSALQVVDREHMQALFDEMNLHEQGLVPESSAAKFGRVAAADYVLSGSFWRTGGRIEIEAHLVEVKTGRLGRVEWAKGEAGSALDLIKQLALAIVKNLKVEPTPAELERMRLLPTNSLDAATQFYTGLSRYDKGDYERALAEFRLACAKDPAYLQARHWTVCMYAQLGEFEHAVVAFRRCIGAAADNDRWGAESAYHLARLYEMNLSADDLAVEAYRALVQRFPDSRYVPDAWRRIGLLLELKEDWIGACTALAKLGGADYRRQCYVYARVLQVCGDVIDPPPFITVIDSKNREVTMKPPFRRDPYHAGDFFKAPKGYQIDRINLEIRGHFNRDEGAGRNLHRIILNVFDFPPWWGFHRTLEISSWEAKTQRGSIPMPAGTRVATLELDAVWSTVEYWKAEFILAKFDEKAFARVLKPYYTKFTVKTTRERVGIPVRHGGGFSPSVIQDRNGRFWAVFNDVGEFNYYGWDETGLESSIWLTTSDDGRNWTRPSLLPINSAAASYNPSLIEARDGRIWLVWTSGRSMDPGHRIWISSTRDGTRWTQPRKIPLGKGRDMLGLPRLFQDRNGTFRLAYASMQLADDALGPAWRRMNEKPERYIAPNGFSAVFLASSPDTIDWTEPKPVPITYTVRDLWAMQDRSGIFRVVSSQRDNGVDISSSADGSDWTLEKYKSKECLEFPALLQNPDGSYLLVYNRQNGGVQAAVSADCKAWRDLGVFNHRNEYNDYGDAPAVTLRRSGGFCLVCGGTETMRKDISVEIIERLPEKRR